jgi:hypothetical protein
MIFFGQKELQKVSFVSPGEKELGAYNLLLIGFRGLRLSSQPRNPREKPLIFLPAALDGSSGRFVFDPIRFLCCYPDSSDITLLQQTNSPFNPLVSVVISSRLG